MQTYQNLWADVGVTNVYCPETLQTVQSNRIHGWTLALQASTVVSLNFKKCTMQTFMGGRWRYKLLVSLNLTNCTMQTYQNSWVEVGVTNV